MVHTDGIPTIANAPARSPFEVVGSFVFDEADDALLDRNTGGISVTLFYNGQHPVLRVIDAEGDHSVIVPKDKALDAFNHPYVYLAR
jgi:hypothetical protein